MDGDIGSAVHTRPVAQSGIGTSQPISSDSTLRILANSTDGDLNKGSLSISDDVEYSSNAVVKSESICKTQKAKTC